ncbi:MAG: hypothetical protein IE916_04180 [Epsilonproteobacteria bacterium]|nr:hypothetical protein [Campylobacterota bacterium]
MPKIKEFAKARSAITAIEIIADDFVAISSKYHGIKVFDAKTLESVRSIFHDSINSQLSAIAFSPDGEHIAFSQLHALLIFHMPTKRIAETIHTHGEEITLLAFDPSSTYIIAGTKNGRVLQYKLGATLPLSRLCSFPHERPRSKIKENYVSALAFHGSKIACSGLGGAVVVMDLFSHANKAVFNLSSWRKDALCFVDKNRLLCGGNDGTLQLYSLKDRRQHKSMLTPFSFIKQILLMPNPNYIMVVGDASYVSIIDIVKQKIVHAKYIDFGSDIEKIVIHSDGSLFIALSSATLLHVELPSIHKLKSLILHNQLDEAFMLVAREPMIQNSPEHILLEQKYDYFYQEAIAALLNQKPELAKQHLAMFQEVPQKKEQIRELFKSFGHYSHFHSLFLEKRFGLCYAIVKKYPALKHTPLFKKLEKQFKETFAFAQKQILLGRDDVAKSILGEYMTVELKRPILNLLLKHNKEFLEFLKAIEQRDYKRIYQLVKTNELFEQIPTYIALSQEIESLITEVKHSIKIGDIAHAKESLDKLQTMPQLAQKVERLQFECNNVLKLQKAYGEKNIKRCYELIDSYRCLGNMELGATLEDEWRDLVKQCEIYALEGNVRSIKASLGELIRLESRKEKVGTLLRLSFHTKIRQLMQHKSYKKCESIIYSYIDIFGIDSEIRHFMQEFESLSKRELAITQKAGDIKRDAWLDSPFITSHLSS